MTVIKFNCNSNSNNAPAYSCNTPGDNSGVYVPSGEVYDLAKKMEKIREGAKIACALARIKYGNLDKNVDTELTRIEILCHES